MLKKIVKSVLHFFLFIILIIVCCILSAIIFNNNYEDKVAIENNVVIEEKGNSDLLSKYYDKAEGIMYFMTLEEKVGQMFIVRYSGDASNKEIIDENPGGYILFGDDFKDETKESILEKLTENQKNSKIPLFLGVDEEGGTVVRVSQFEEFRDERFQSPQEIFIKYGINKILSDSNEKTTLLKSIGLNMNLTPVVDIPANEDSFIYDRSFGTDISKTNEYAEKIITQMNTDKIVSVMKHFPGYGDNLDTHKDMVIDDREYEEFKNKDFIPFIKGIEAGAPVILVSHNIVNCMDDELPASLSPKVNKILREDLKFSGLIMTDDLEMGAIKNFSDNSATQAVIAGNDLIISSNFKEEKKQVIDAVNAGTISEEQINTAVKRILACKLLYEIIK